MKNTEVWKDIKHYKGIYQVSTFGNVKSFKYGGKRILKAGSVTKSTPYLTISLSKNGVVKRVKIHKLVAGAFLNHDSTKSNLVVDHINGNPADNNLQNLQTITHRENTSKDKKNGSSKYTGVYWNKANKKWRSRIYTKNKTKHLGYFTNELEASEAYQKELKIIIIEEKKEGGKNG